jgi:hypothetical protein
VKIKDKDEEIPLDAETRRGYFLTTDKPWFYKALKAFLGSIFAAFLCNT